MPTQEEKQAAVQDAANAFAALETALAAIPALADDAKAKVQACYALGIGKQSEKVIIDGKLSHASGRASGALSTVVEAHERGTAAAVREGCDVPPALAVGEISPMGGGTR
jgi:hypothetical protein